MSFISGIIDVHTTVHTRKAYVLLRRQSSQLSVEELSNQSIVKQHKRPNIKKCTLNCLPDIKSPCTYVRTYVFMQYIYYPYTCNQYICTSKYEFSHWLQSAIMILTREKGFCFPFMLYVRSYKLHVPSLCTVVAHVRMYAYIRQLARSLAEGALKLQAPNFDVLKLVAVQLDSQELAKKLERSTDT